jgi:sialic acid synthase SpsE
MTKPETKKYKLGDHVFLTAEIGTNHMGSIDIAKKIIDMAADAGYDAAISIIFLAISMLPIWFVPISAVRNT